MGSASTAIFITMKKISFLLFLFSIVFLSCVKEEKRWVELPSLSGIGSNYMAFYRNGIPYIVDGLYQPPGFAFNFNPNRNGVEFDLYEQGTERKLVLSAIDGKSEKDFSLELTFDYLPGLYNLNKLDTLGKFKIISELTQTFSLNTALENTIAFRKTTDTIVAGTFTIHLKNNQGEVLILEDGRFDIGK